LAANDRITRITFSQDKIQLALTVVHFAATGLHKHRQLSVRVRRTEVLDHLVPAADTLGDLDRRRTRRGPDLPKKHHEKARYPTD
jgi:hypothetical protein